MLNGIEKRECFIAMFDILGFSKLVEENKLEQVADVFRDFRSLFHENFFHINKLHSGFDESFDAGGVASELISYRNFSDTFLIYSANTDKINFRSILTACDFLFLAANKFCLPIRGTLNAGEVIISSEMQIGRPIVDAYKAEKEQDWIGCWIMDNCFRFIKKPRPGFGSGILEYEIPFKKDSVRRCYAFNWINSVVWATKRETTAYISKEDIKKRITFLNAAIPDWPAKRKIENTSRFVDSILTEEFIAHVNDSRYWTIG